MTLLEYFRRHVKIIVLLAACMGVCALVFWLYRLPTEPVLYAALLCLLVGAALFAVGFSRWSRRLRELEAMKGRVTVELEGLPKPAGAVEANYQELLRLLHQEKNRIETRAAEERRDMTDYHTLWAHQIKTPISAMRLLLAEPEPDGEALSTELFSIERYVEMMLGYIRLDSGTTDYVFRDYPLEDIVRQAVRKHARFFVARRLSLELGDLSLTVRTDEKWLLFVIEQVLSNSLKYTRQGGIRIYTEGQRLVIADTGIGVRPEDLPRVFEKGFTGYNGRADKKSTGIGLYLCRRVCDALGHDISMNSELGVGTAVYIDLTRRPAVVE